MPAYSYIISNGKTKYRVIKSYRGNKLNMRGFRSKAAALAHERNWMNRIDAGVLGNRIEITFFDYKEWWLATKQDLKPSTLATYNCILGNYSNEVGFLNLTSFTPILIQELINKKTTPKTKLNHLTLFRTMFDDAVNFRYLTDNPARHVTRPKYRQKEMRFLNLEEARDLISVACGDTKTIIELAILTGMRRGEIFGLKKGDIRDDHLIVQRTKYRKGEVPPKSQYSFRRIPLSPVLVKELRYVQKQNPRQPYLFNYDPDNFVKRKFKPLIGELELPAIRFHDLRHTFAALMISRGVNPKFLQRVMGHESFKTTMDLYGHLYPEEHNGVINGLTEEVLFRG